MECPSLTSVFLNFDLIAGRAMCASAAIGPKGYELQAALHLFVSVAHRIRAAEHIKLCGRMYQWVYQSQAVLYKYPEYRSAFMCAKYCDSFSCLGINYPKFRITCMFI